MSGHLEKSIVLADKIAQKAEEALDGLDREMAIMKWPAEFRVIVWAAVVAVASGRMAEAKRQSQRERA